MCHLLFASYDFCPVFQDLTTYNAFEKDIAVVNVFFGKSTAFGKTQIK